MSRWDFRSAEALYEFDMQLDMLCMSKGFGITGINLSRSWRLYGERNPLVFYGIIDIKVNLLNIFSCVRELRTLWPRIDPESTFRFQRLWFEFVCLYRAFYDKYMSLMIRCGWPDQLKQFEKAKSKNAEFRRIVSGSGAAYVADGVFLAIPEPFCERCYGHIKYVNDQYRTPEVHGAGKARKWIFSHRPEEESEEYAKFRQLVDDMGEFLHLLGVVAGGREYAQELERANAEHREGHEPA
jgi:hypothetical protein